MKLEKILKNCQTKFTVENLKNITLKGVSTNSKDIKDNFLFGAIEGKKFNGENFIKDLILIKNLVVVLSIKSETEKYKKNYNLKIFIQLIIRLKL